jgi:hypothetical protein
MNDMKKFREETVEYWQEEESGRVVMTVEEKYLIEKSNGEDRWVVHNKTIPLA